MPSPNLGRIAAEKKRETTCAGVAPSTGGALVCGSEPVNFRKLLPFQGKSIGFWAMARRKAGLVRVGHNIIAYACCICGASPGSGAAGGEWVLIMVVAMEEAVRAAPVLLGSRFCDANSMPYALGKVIR